MRARGQIQHAGNINVPIYEQLYDADLVIANLSTANPNAFFELGVRYGLKPRTTIVIAEKGFKLPFDMGQVIDAVLRAPGRWHRLRRSRQGAANAQGGD